MSDILCYDALGSRVTQLYQWDVNQRLTIHGVETSPLPTFQFSNRVCGTTISKTPIANNGKLIVDVPNELLQSAEPILMYIYRKRSTGAGTTIGSFFIPVHPRAKPDTNVFNE